MFCARTEDLGVLIALNKLWNRRGLIEKIQEQEVILLFNSCLFIKEDNMTTNQDVSSAVRNVLVVLLFAALLPLPLTSQASLIPFDITFTDTGGSTFPGSFKVLDSDIAAKNLFVSVYDFTTTINGITYASGDIASIPNPFTGLAAYDVPTNELVGLSTPYIGVPGQPSLVYFIMDRSGGWTATDCTPKPFCAYSVIDTGVYVIAKSATVSEPASLPLILLGLAGAALMELLHSRRVKIGSTAVV